MTLYYVSLPTETPSPYKQDYHYSTIRVREGSRDPYEMTDEDVGLWEKERERKKRECVSGETGVMEQVDSHLSCPR